MVLEQTGSALTLSIQIDDDLPATCVDWIKVHSEH
jgi:hypothetical protein